MPFNEGQLSGSADYRVRITLDLVSQDGARNLSTFRWGLAIHNPNGQGAWFNDPGSWSVTIAGGGASGSWNRPSGSAGTVFQEFGAGYIEMGHNGEGILAGFYNTGAISSPHSAIGNGSVDMWVDAPRIAKRPAAAGTPTFSEIANNSVRVSWAASPDNRGAAIDSYLLRYWEGPTATGPYVDHSTQLNTSRVVSGLTPGQQYTFAVYAHNGATWDGGGFAPASPSATVSLLAGVYVSDGVNWIPQALRESDGTAWVNLNPKISSGSAWQEPTIV